MSDTAIPWLPLFRDDLSGIEVKPLIIGSYLDQVSTIIEVFSVRHYHLHSWPTLEEASKHSSVAYLYWGMVRILSSYEETHIEWQTSVGSNLFYIVMYSLALEQTNLYSLNHHNGAALDFVAIKIQKKFAAPEPQSSSYIQICLCRTPGGIFFKSWMMEIGYCTICEIIIQLIQYKSI